MSEPDLVVQGYHWNFASKKRKIEEKTKRKSLSAQVMQHIFSPCQVPLFVKFQASINWGRELLLA